MHGVNRQPPPTLLNRGKRFQAQKLREAFPRSHPPFVPPFTPSFTPCSRFCSRFSFSAYIQQSRTNTENKRDQSTFFLGLFSVLVGDIIGGLIGGGAGSALYSWRQQVPPTSDNMTLYWRFIDGSLAVSMTVCCRQRTGVNGEYSMYKMIVTVQASLYLMTMF